MAMCFSRLRHDFVKFEEFPEVGEVHVDIKLAFDLDGVGECEQRRKVVIKAQNFSKKWTNKRVAAEAAWTELEQCFDLDDGSENIFADLLKHSDAQMVQALRRAIVEVPVTQTCRVPLAG